MPRSRKCKACGVSLVGTGKRKWCSRKCQDVGYAAAPPKRVQGRHVCENKDWRTTKEGKPLRWECQNASPRRRFCSRFCERLAHMADVERADVELAILRDEAADRPPVELVYPIAELMGDEPVEAIEVPAPVLEKCAYCKKPVPPGRFKTCTNEHAVLLWIRERPEAKAIYLKQKGSCAQCKRPIGAIGFRFPEKERLLCSICVWNWRMEQVRKAA